MTRLKRTGFFFLGEQWRKGKRESQGPVRRTVVASDRIKLHNPEYFNSIAEKLQKKRIIVTNRE
jgi:hypothetical protein